MSRVAGLWGQLTDKAKEAVWRACGNAIGDPGGDLIVALAEHAVEYQAFMASMQAATEVPLGDPYPFLVPAEQAGPRAEQPRCHCGRPVAGRLLPWVVERDGQRVVEWLGEGCYRDRLLHRRRGPEVAGDQLQAFPTPMPIQEEP